MKEGIGKDGRVVWNVTCERVHIKTVTHITHTLILLTRCSQTTLSKNLARKKTSFKCCHLSSFAAEPLFFDTGTRFQTHSLFVYTSRASKCCFEPYFTLTGIIDTYANRANSPRQHHILWHQRQKVDLAWMACACAKARINTQTRSHIRQSSFLSHSSCK